MATLAVSMGALEFMATGDVKTKVVENPEEGTNIEAVKQLHDACQQHRGPQVTPRWFVTKDQKYGWKFGCVLKIQLSLHSFRVFSSDTTFDSYFAAKADCARIAIAEGVLDYIKNDASAYSAQSSTFATISRSLPETSTLQAFYESLPRPFPEDFGDKTAIEINGPGYLNSVMQSARGSKLTTKFIPFSVPGPFYGCLLRLEHPGECKSYLADPLFTKRNDAKAAVCFQAFSEGICTYIRAAGDTTEMKVSEAMKKLAINRIIPSLNSEHTKKRPGVPLEYKYTTDQDAFGCSLTLLLNDPPGPNESRTYSVPAEYRTKNDAKLALVCHAAKEGAIEFLRYSGRPPPRNHVPFLANGAAKLLAEQNSTTGKRKEPETSEVNIPPKRLKQEPQTPEIPTLEVANSSTSATSSRKRKLSEAGHDDGTNSRRTKYVRSTTPQFAAEGDPNMGGRKRNWTPNVGYGHAMPDTRLRPGEGSLPLSTFEPFSRQDEPARERYYGSNPAHFYGSDPEHSRHLSSDRPGHGNVYSQGYYSGGSRGSDSKPPKEEPQEPRPPIPLPDSPTISSRRPVISPDPTNWAVPAVPAVPGDASRRSNSQTTDRGGNHSRRANKPVRSHLDELLAYCNARPELPRPVFHDKMVDSTHHKVWLIMGPEQFELQMTFRTIWEGRQRLSKKVLERLRGTQNGTG